MGNDLPLGQWWAADTGCFNRPTAYTTEGYIKWLKNRLHRSGTCLFATAPDIVGNAKATLKRAIPVLPLIRQAGYRAALVAQDGMEDEPIPWSSFDCLFVGGTTDWKLSGAARGLVDAARVRGKWCHIGRVNSWRRTWMMAQWGADSVDGTYLCFGPNVLLPRLMSWLHRLDENLGPVNICLPNIGKDDESAA
jgi:hypothetical protein